MSGITADTSSSIPVPVPGAAKPHLDGGLGRHGPLIIIGILVVGVAYAAYSLVSDVDAAGAEPTTWVPFALLAVALLIALGFEFVNGFHDTANAVATVIYTHSLPAPVAVVWSGFFNFLGVVTSSGAVAYGIVSLLPVELILRVGSGAGLAMVFSLLIAAIIWNLGTWYMGLPASSSHTLIGSIIGVGWANELTAVAGAQASGVDWSQARGVFEALLLSPLVGFVGAALLLLAMKLVVRNKRLYQAPETTDPPPRWIRGLLILTCTGVSFAHGSNDGQKGMGLIMLILIGVVPAAYSLNRAVPDSATPGFIEVSTQAATALRGLAGDSAPAVGGGEMRKLVEDYLQTDKRTLETLPAMAALADDIARQVRGYGAIRRVPAEQVQNVRNDMYLVDEALRQMGRLNDPHFDEATAATVKEYRGTLDRATRFIPTWVKVSVAIALGLGTMVGWKRIVVTVAERIGKSHLSYGQGAAAELVAAATIGAADVYGLPVSTTHVLSSGVAGTMAANGTGLQWATVRNIALAWVLTLPAAMLLAGGIYIVARQFVG
ncbi:inorganic phosphate transporter [Muricoccus aerilatus]|uniref:inorganic phosphate transporter n=1 Tax=Muricoccus aerilatus TaxID=452982 RepID=UPI0005C19AFA|nr:inorganic phosphate transporter [Roseomonas aerilata]